jgi:hypothetical protein
MNTTKLKLAKLLGLIRQTTERVRQLTGSRTDKTACGGGVGSGTSAMGMTLSRRTTVNEHPSEMA